MGVRVSDQSHVCLYDSVTGTAFGPVLSDPVEADDFLSWLGNRDARDIREDVLAAMYQEFVQMREREVA
jgi:hypothetical protein